MDCCKNANAKEPQRSPRTDRLGETKAILLYQNGQEFTQAKRFILNMRQTKDWDSFLQQVTDFLQPKNGYVRAIYTPEGDEVRSFRQIQNKKAYVAVSTWETFRQCAHVPAYDRIVSPRPFKITNPKAAIRTTKHIEPMYVPVPYAYYY